MQLSRIVALMLMPKNPSQYADHFNPTQKDLQICVSRKHLYFASMVLIVFINVYRQPGKGYGGIQVAD